MKKPTILLTLFAMILSACSAASSGQNRSANGKTLNAMSQLAVGTLKLDGTGNAVTKQQAAELLPLWQVYKQLAASDTAAQAEIDGLTSQIRDAMTSGQRKAITDMKLSQSDVFAYIQQANSAASGQSSRSSTSQGPGGGFPGGDPGGMPPDMGSGMPGGGMPGGSTTRQASGTQTANSGQAGAQSGRPVNMDRVPSPLIDAVIRYLQKISAS